MDIQQLLTTPTQAPTEVPDGFVPYTDAELLDLQDRILKAKKGDTSVTKPSKEELERAYRTIRNKRNASAPKEKSSSKAKVAPMSAQDMAMLFGGTPK